MINALAMSVVMAAATALPSPPAIASAPIVAVAPAAGPILPRNTPVVLALNETLNTKSSRTKVGNTFTLSVAHNVKLGRYIVIPRGSKATGTVLWKTKKGGFGKSGKMEIALNFVEVGDQRIALEGHQREEGEGNSSATVATFVFLSMIGSGLITGHSAEIPAGREITAWTKEDVPVILPDSVAANSPDANGIVATLPPELAKKASTPEISRVPFGNGRMRCVTCQ